MTFSEVMHAKVQRDIIRQEIIRAVAALPEVPEEIRALLIADAEASREFEQRFTLYQERQP